MISKKISSVLKDAVKVTDKVKIKEKDKLTEIIDDLVYEAVFGNDEDKLLARWIIWEIAQSLNILPSSIHNFYIARANEKIPLDITVPAMNLRGMAYDCACAAFRSAAKINAKAMIFEISRSEMGYTDQSPQEYATVVLAAAIKEGHEGPVFLQGDHFQTKSEFPGKPKKGEVETIKKLILESIKNGFYNIDIDTSTLVDLGKKTEEEQQKANIKYSVELAKFIRENEPKDTTVSIGGEIGHIGGVNSTVKDFEAYMSGFNKGLKDNVGMSKISIQTGTSHGGVVLPDGTLADINVDFNVLLDISKACRRVGLGGSVQHGASTLPDEFFKQFAKAQAVEVHLATGFQNIIMDHSDFPKKLLSEIYDWLDKNKSDERKDDQTDEQFHYKLRKKSWGQFKKQSWDIKNKDKLMKSLEERFDFLFNELNIKDTDKLIKKTIKLKKTKRELTDFTLETATKKQVRGLSD